MASVAGRTTVARWLSLLVVLLAFTSCTPASPSVDTYRERTKLAVTDSLSHVATAHGVVNDARLGPGYLSWTCVESVDWDRSVVTLSVNALEPLESA